MARLDMNALAMKADAQGWYVFGDTRFKGAVVDGAPDGVGLCIVKGMESSAQPCSFSGGVRTDEAYVQSRRTVLSAQTAEQIADARRDQLENQRRERERVRQANRDSAAFHASLGQYIAQMPAQMAGDMKRLDAISRGTSVEEEEAKARRATEFYARIAREEADPNSSLNQDKRAREREVAERKQADTKREAERAAKRDADIKTASANKERSVVEERQREDAEKNARKKEEAEALRAQQDRETRRQVLEKEKEREREREALKRERDAKIAAEKAEREARVKAEKVAKVKTESDFLAEVKRQFRLVAGTCPGGEGRYFALGVNPNIKPEIVACYGIQFRAVCRGGGISAYGATSHFRSGALNCFAGEAVPMEPKLSCKPEDIQITVTEVTPC